MRRPYLCTLWIQTAESQHRPHIMAAAAPAAGLGAEPMLTYWERNPPYAAIALAQEAKVELQHAADPKATKETITKLQFPNGYVEMRIALHGRPSYIECASLACVQPILHTVCRQQIPCRSFIGQPCPADPQGGADGSAFDPQVHHPSGH